jgi:hypothetical protein
MYAADGYESVDAVLRRRGHVPVMTGKLEDTILPWWFIHPGLNRKPDHLYELRKLLATETFRKLLRALTAAHGGAVQLAKLTGIAGGATEEYLSFLEHGLRIVERAAAGVWLTKTVDNIGPTLEWYVADLCEQELRGSAAWSVQLEGVPIGGDYDVLAWLDLLVYIELKSSAPKDVSDSELKQFLQRSQELAPEVAVLLIDTDTSLAPLLDRLNAVILPVLRKASGIADPAWQPERPSIQPLPDFPGVSFGHRRIYITNSQPSILTQLRRCVRHHHAHIKGTTFLGGPKVNYVTGEVGEERY